MQSERVSIFLFSVQSKWRGVLPWLSAASTLAPCFTSVLLGIKGCVCVGALVSFPGCSNIALSPGCSHIVSSPGCSHIVSFSDCPDTVSSPACSYLYSLIPRLPWHSLIPRLLLYSLIPRLPWHSLVPRLLLYSLIPRLPWHSLIPRLLPYRTQGCTHTVLHYQVNKNYVVGLGTGQPTQCSMFVKYQNWGGNPHCCSTQLFY